MLTYAVVFGVFAIRINIGTEQKQMINLGHWDIFLMAEYDPVRDKGRKSQVVIFCKYWTGWKVQFRNSMMQQCPLMYRARPLY